jgi:hypothetical protein
MATIDWPAGLIPQAAELSLRKAGAQFASPFNGTLQSVDFIAERWVLSCSLAPQFQHDPRGVGPFANILAGGVERVRVWPFHTGGVPRGSLRGAPTLGTTATRGQQLLNISNAGALSNLLRGSSFEVDSNADGLADNWASYAGGVSTSPVWSRVAGLRGAFAQRMDVVSLGATDADRVGLRHAVDQPVTPGASYGFAAHMRAPLGQMVLNVDWRDSGGGYLSSSMQAFAASTSWQRPSIQLTAPPSAAIARLFVWLQDAGAVAAAAWFEVDNVQWEVGSVTDYGFLPSVLYGDFIGCGGQLFMVQEDTLLNDLGNGNVPVINRVRGTIASGSAVTWYRPTCEMVLPAMQAGPVRRPGVIESTALDLVEVW